MTCILCHSHAQVYFVDDKNARQYYACQTCKLKFLNPSQRLSKAKEHERYHLHQNNPDDLGYQNYLRPVLTTILDKLGNTPKNIKLLDFGAGRDSALSVLFKNEKVEYSSYDPVYQNDLSLLEQLYDAVVATEVIEHVYEPEQVIKKLKNLLRPKGLLIIMTQFLETDTDFKNWYYRRDPTHVAFYSQETMQYIFNTFSFTEHEIIGNRLSCFRL